MQFGFHFDQTRCTGCEACVVACKDWNDIPAGEARLLRVVQVEEGRFPNVGLRFHPLGCFHCAQPPCVGACPSQAIRKRPKDGVVLVEAELCLTGCRRCLEACPYQAPQFIGEGPARLCDLCLDRWEVGKKPICVLACSQQALDAGPLAELQARYGGEHSMKDFPDPSRTGASIVFRPKA